jgi:hypothetical protein
MKYLGYEVYLDEINLDVKNLGAGGVHNSFTSTSKFMLLYMFV